MVARHLPCYLLYQIVSYDYAMYVCRVISCGVFDTGAVKPAIGDRGQPEDVRLFMLADGFLRCRAACKRLCAWVQFGCEPKCSAAHLRLGRVTSLSARAGRRIKPLRCATGIGVLQSAQGLHYLLKYRLSK